MNSKNRIIDTFGRTIKYLRISVTDVCTMRCVYCAPDNKTNIPESEKLTIGELSRIAGVAIGCGISKIRLTGGEPLAFAGIEKLAARISSFPGIEDLSLTTNGLALEEFAPSLKSAGLSRVNVSLDTLDPGKFKNICRAGSLDRVISGIDAAVKAGLSPVKINVVVRRGSNENELVDFIDFSQSRGVTVRFIEYMPTRKAGAAAGAERVPSDEVVAAIKSRLASGADFINSPGEPARYLPLRGGGAVGIISPVTHGFCDNCNRMRLTPDGFLRGCLFSDERIEIKSLIRNGCEDSDIINAFQTAAAQKGRCGDFAGTRPQMHQIGG